MRAGAYVYVNLSAVVKSFRSGAIFPAYTTRRAQGEAGRGLRRGRNNAGKLRKFPTGFKYSSHSFCPRERNEEESFYFESKPESVFFGFHMLNP